MKLERIDCKILGRNVGVASGWDMQDTFVIILYDFVPGPGVFLPTGDVTFDFTEGTYVSYTDDGEVAASGDILTALKDAPLYE